MTKPKIFLSKSLRDKENKKKEKENGPLYKACLDHGFVKLVDHMGDDTAIEQGARVSYGEGTRKTSQTRGLIRYLLKHKHTSPFELVDFKFHVKMPIFVARQWVRHRTASINEYSARYSILNNEYYIPLQQDMATQSVSNKQGRNTIVDKEEYAEYVATIRSICDNAYGRYEFLLNDKNKYNLYNKERNGLARELARMVLPVNFYTEWYWKSNLHNLFHFLKLRMDSHAQYEIRVFAEAIFSLIKPIVPIAAEAFEDYILNAVTLSKQEINIIIDNLPEDNKLKIDKKYSNTLSEREITEFKNILKKPAN